MSLRRVPLVALCGALATASVSAAPKAPCYTQYLAKVETMCSTVVAQSGNFTVRDYATASTLRGPVTPTLASTPSTDTNFTTGSVQATGITIDYFLYGNAKVEHIPLTTPLIFRPDPAGTWVASFALPPSLFPVASGVPAPEPPGPTEFEVFSNKRVAAYVFYTVYLATQAQYEAACATLDEWVSKNGYTPVPGAWAQAWVTYSPQAEVGLRVNECWTEVASS